MNKILRWNLGTLRVLALPASLIASSASAATAQQVSSFGNNPTGIGMYLYTPSNVVSRPPILVGVHACHGKGTDVCVQGSPFAAQADKYGFLLVCPSAVSSDGCWDVHSNAVLTHGGGGDASGIISMVDYVVHNKNGDASRVFVAGHSSGGMMTNVLVGSYPDVFQAGAAFAGVPFACFAQGSVSMGWNAACANGNVTMTGMQWGALVRAAYPGFSGDRPRMQLWHGTTDATVNFHNFGEEIKEWTDVLGVSDKPTTTENDAVRATWVRTRYVDSCGVVRVEAIQETGQPHNLVVDMANAVHFFGLDGTNPGSCSAGGAGAGGAGSGGAVAGAGGAGGNAGRSGGGTGGTGLSGAGGEFRGSAGDAGAGGVAGAGGAAAVLGGEAATGGSPTQSGGSIGAGGSSAPAMAGSGAVSAGAGGGDPPGCSCGIVVGQRTPGHEWIGWMLLGALACACRSARD